MSITFGSCVVDKFTERFYTMIKTWKKSNIFYIPTYLDLYGFCDRFVLKYVMPLIVIHIIQRYTHTGLPESHVANGIERENF